MRGAERAALERERTWKGVRPFVFCLGRDGSISDCCSVFCPGLSILAFPRGPGVSGRAPAKFRNAVHLFAQGEPGNLKRRFFFLPRVVPPGASLRFGGGHVASGQTWNAVPFSARGVTNQVWNAVPFFVLPKAVHPGVPRFFCPGLILLAFPILELLKRAQSCRPPQPVAGPARACVRERVESTHIQYIQGPQIFHSRHAPQSPVR